MENTSTLPKLVQHGALLALVLLLALWLRIPFIGTGIPYFYDEDEAHHFNRVVNMVKRGDYNPHYFHKPSLHFYLRMPVVSASFLAGVKAGEIRKVEEIVTRDEFGVGGYSFSVSHPKILKWTRAFSVLLSLGTVFLVWLMARELRAGPLVQVGAALLTAVSSELVRYSAVVGVDTLMGFMACLAVYLTLRAVRVGTAWSFLWSGLAAGLAVSSKYNALPIVLVPVLGWLVGRNWKIGAFVAVIVGPVVGFLMGTPYSVVELPLFLDQFGYEIWHYKIAGHEGHSAEPGLAQVVHYGRWLFRDAMSGVGLAMAVVGLLGVVGGDWRRKVVVYAFPVLFFILMCLQRTNFTRNMIVVVPFLALAAFWAVQVVVAKVGGSIQRKRITSFLLAALVVLPPLFQTFLVRAEAGQTSESRVDLESWLTANPEELDIAVAGDLQVAPNIYQRQGVVRVKVEELNPEALYQQGFTTLIVGPSFLDRKNKWLIEEKKFEGRALVERVVTNPEIVVYRLTPPAEWQGGSTSRCVKDAEFWHCGGEEQEGHHWINKRREALKFEGSGGIVRSGFKFEVMSPWSGQVLRVSMGKKLVQEIRDLEPGTWASVSVGIPPEKSREDIQVEFEITKIYAPAARGAGADLRRLGVAVKGIKLSS